MSQWRIVLNSTMIEEAKGDWYLAALISLLRNEQETNYDTDNYADEHGERWFRFSTKTMLTKLHGITEKQLKLRIKKCIDMGVIRTCSNWRNPFDKTRLIHVDVMSCTIGTKGTIVNGTFGTVDNKEEPLRRTFKRENKKNTCKPTDKNTDANSALPTNFLKSGQAKDRAHIALLSTFPKLNAIGYNNLVDDFQTYADGTAKVWMNDRDTQAHFVRWASLKKWEDVRQPADRVKFKPMKEI